MELHEYSIEELKAEIRKRKYAKNNEWYYIYEDEDESDPEWISEFPSFIIIHKRRYHLLHELHKTNVGGLLPVPKSFQQLPDHRCKYKLKNASKKAEKELQNHGFCKLEKPFLGDKALLFYTTPLFEVKWHTENEESKLNLEQFLLDKCEVDLFEKFVESCKEYAKSIDHVAFFFKDFSPRYSHGETIHVKKGTLNPPTFFKDAALVPISIFEKLPKNPYPRQGDEE